MIRKRIRFIGGVQGVGFRYRALRSAGLSGATGWVRNESDGSVIMEIQGTPEQIDNTLRVLGESRYIRIRETVSAEIPVVPEEKGFGVRF